MHSSTYIELHAGSINIELLVMRDIVKTYILYYINYIIHYIQRIMLKISKLNTKFKYQII